MKQTYIVAGYVVDSKIPDLTQEDLKKLTHLNVAFGHVKDDVIITDHIKHMDMLQKIKDEHPELNLILSVGGWSAGGFSEAASSEEGRSAMANSAVRVLIDYPFDGIDLDWEYPCYGEAGIESSPDDKKNFTLLLKTIREALDRQGAQDERHYLLTIAAGADQYYVDGTEMDQVQQYLDFVQLMTYDMRGGFQVLTGHHTNLHTSPGDLFRISTESSINMFVRAGVPREKIVIGVAFYSRVWKQVPDINHGLHQMAGSTGGYGPDFTDLSANYINKNGYTRHWDEEAKAPFLFNGTSFISYDDEESLEHKCEYVKNHNLAGMMFWEYGCDKTHRLLDTMHKGL
ncbi:glycoside hydrolase family 18 protein [Paenibacillus macquariensis]|uniref:chitinase n=1 Tax=Paenibacillus macquariensis TaxID=948756 RepID=A0ABY1K6E0_9BACL|nr:glycoside hydrolase family 18 protein [Paenibacillus macquariensis]MEC0093579.1 glycoside hydrolase family 18 protein [Paenibacillus macquariensis]OAB35599.1 chitinase [Paenibacillus macquariensis subsp. macquariensis]SIR32808.1 chitinase [Paenibacillus macquariensis]